jgi:hypothetical protein
MAIQAGVLDENKMLLLLIKDFLIFSVRTPSPGTDLVKVSDAIGRSSRSSRSIVRQKADSFKA